ncbi:hypothetical protein N9B82_06285 [Saprospiraceae bacterium]|nr:hypothetical protein [Saprospiraceae bacterium]
MEDPKRKLKRELTEVHEKMYALEMDELLLKLSEKFDQWKNKRLTGFELQDELRKYQKREFKDLYFLYDVTTFADINAARCAQEGKLDLETVSPELKELIKSKVKYLEQ